MGDTKQPYAFLFTLRPKSGITDATVSNFKSWWPAMFEYCFAVLEKEGTERHLHAVCFPRIQQQRSNVSSQCVKHVLFDWDEPSIRNFKFVPKKGAPPCLKHAYSTSVITEYLSGGIKEKAGDPFSIITDVLPDDLSDLEPYFRDNYVREKSLWYRSLLRNFQTHLGWPKTNPGVVTEWSTVLQSIKYLENHFVIDSSLQNPNVLIWRAKKFTQIWNNSTLHEIRENWQFEGHTDLHWDKISVSGHS